MSNAVPPAKSENPVSPYLSLVTLRDAHRQLLHRRREGGDSQELWAVVEEFLQRGRAAGAFLDTDEDRMTAQNLLDYWENQLYHAGKSPEEAILAEFNPQLQPEIPDHRRPYVGLGAFRQHNHDVFFGRRRLIEELINQVLATRLVAVVGPSGSGKSSVVLAGLLPKLRQGALPDSETWRYYSPIVPGSTPLVALVQLLKPPEVDDSMWLIDNVEKLRTNANHLTTLIDEAEEQPAVLVVDQFEETFTLCHDEDEREAFINNLLQLVQSPGPRHVVILTMRTDYESFLNKVPLLQSMFQQGEVRVTAMNAAELREAIEGPAEAVGLKFEEGLVEQLIREILGEPAALPLLQFALLKLWDNRERNRVTWETYRRLGGVTQALANTADAFYENLLPEEQVTARRILMRIVRPSEGLEVTRNRVPRKMLYQAGGARDRVDRVLDKLIESHLVHLTKGNSPDDDQVEIAHEALVRNWPRLVDWLDEERITLRHRQRLTAQAQQWERLDRDPGALLRGAMLREATTYDDLNELETEFIRASQAALQKEEAEKEAARQREIEQARALAEEQSERAEAERERAEAEALAAARARYFSIALVLVFIIGVASILLFTRTRTLQTEATAAAVQAAADTARLTSEAIVAQATQAAVAADQTRAAADIATSQAQVMARSTAEAATAAAGAAATATTEVEAVVATATAQATATSQSPLAPGPPPTPNPEDRANQLRIDARLNSIVRQKDNMPMLFVKGDTFSMGAADDDANAADDERPQHTVTVSDFYIDQFEVSARQFAAFMNSTGSYRNACDGFDCVLTGFDTAFSYLLSNVGFFEPKAGFENHPANWVSWYGAQSYCEWVDARLPTEAEWEYAAGGVDGRLYPWGNAEPEQRRANYGQSLPDTPQEYFSRFVPVDALPEGHSPFGVFNMAGNVWEWVQDAYDPDYYELEAGAAANENNTGLRVVRGGSWQSTVAALRTTARFGLSPRVERPGNVMDNDVVYWGIGFRCARDAGE